jgi:hypothetical protein
MASYDAASNICQTLASGEDVDAEEAAAAAAAEAAAAEAAEAAAAQAAEAAAADEEEGEGDGEVPGSNFTAGLILKFTLGEGAAAGAYTRPLFSSTWAASDTKYTPDTPCYPLTHPTNPLDNP